MKRLKKETKDLFGGKRSKMRIGKCLAAAVILCGLAGAGAFSLRVEAAQEAAKTPEGENGEAAAAAAEQGLILEAKKRVEMKAAPEKTAETLMTFQAGDLIFAVEETEDGWYRVVYQEKEGYVEKGGLTVLELDIEGLDAEMAVNEAETKFVVEAVEKYRADARRSKIWGAVIILLVASIFGVGIFSAVRTNQNGGGEEDGGGSEEKNHKKGRKGGFGKRKPRPEPEQMEIEDLD